MEPQTILKVSILEHIEWHDGQFEKILIRPKGVVEIFFKHLCTYHRLSSNKIEVWSSKALLVLNGVTSLNIDNIISDQSIDGELIDVEGNEVSLIPIFESKPVRLFKIYVAGAGTNINIVAETAVFESLEPIEKLEELKE